MKISVVSSALEKAECYRLRHIVFVEEQGVPVELEIDAHDDADAIHFLGRAGGEAMAASRICLFGDSAKIQRVVVLKNHRGNGAGRVLIQFMIDHIKANDLAPHIALDAQTYALSFYESLGFVAQGDEFDDAGIPHIHMARPA